jgi:hypothetical protein
MCLPKAGLAVRTSNPTFKELFQDSSHASLFSSFLWTPLCVLNVRQVELEEEDGMISWQVFLGFPQSLQECAGMVP